jgi:hypothetical protein
MRGDNRVRYCEECKLNVYNFSAMTSRQIDALIEQHEGRLCGRFYQRSDGTMLAKNCPTGFRAAVIRASGFATAALSTLLSLVPTGVAQSNHTKESVSKTEEGPAVLFLEVDDAAGAVIPKAQVTIKNKAARIKLTQQTNDEGQIKIPDLPKGKYKISIAAPGFKTKTIIHVAGSDGSLRKVILDVGTTYVTVGVVAVVNRNSETNMPS